MSQKTALYDLHLSLGGRMVPFAGYDMPLGYKDGTKAEHLHCRESAGLFDVSHMGQLLIRGSGIAEALEKLVPADVGALADNQQVYSLLLNEQGGVLDDLIITRRQEDCFFVVVNAACKQQDIDHLRKHLPDSLEMEVLEQHSLLALQGPKAVEVMKALAPAATELTFMNACHASIDGAECYITRSGYTGEDGFEISVPSSAAVSLAQKLVDFPEVKPIGLGARDTLRLEAGLCLYGNDMNSETTPIEAGLIWTIPKNRRPGGAKEGGFPGADNIFKQIEQGVAKKRVGIKVLAKVPVREGATLQDGSGQNVGTVCSGVFAPTLEQPIAMAYVDLALAKVDTGLQAEVRGKTYPAVVAKMPFVPQRYYRG